MSLVIGEELYYPNCIFISIHLEYTNRRYSLPLSYIIQPVAVILSLHAV